MGSGAQTGGSTPGLTLGAIGGSGSIPAGSSGTIAASLAGPATAGAINQAFTYTFADDSTLSGHLSSVGTAPITVTGNVYTGQGVWNQAAERQLGQPDEHVELDHVGRGAGPGPELLGHRLGDVWLRGRSGPLTVSLNGASPSLAALTFQSSNSYTIARGSSGVLKLNGGTAAAAVSVTGSHLISAPVELDSNASLTTSGTGDFAPGFGQHQPVGRFAGSDGQRAGPRDFQRQQQLLGGHARQRAAGDQQPRVASRRLGGVDRGRWCAPAWRRHRRGDRAGRAGSQPAGAGRRPRLWLGHRPCRSPGRSSSCWPGWPRAESFG